MSINFLLFSCSGKTVLIENIEETLDPTLDHLLGRNLIKKGKLVKFFFLSLSPLYISYAPSSFSMVQYICIDIIFFPCLKTRLLFRAIKLGDKEVEYNQNFCLILQTKLANPHYKPEMQAQTTLINFTVTRDGLEDQLLAEVVRAERPDLEELKAQLTKQQNDFKIMLKTLEDDLLSRLSSAGENILGDTALVENLEITKRTATEIEEKVCITTLHHQYYVTLHILS